MEVFVLMGGIESESSQILGVYTSEDEAVNARNVYNRDLRYEIYDFYFVERNILDAPVDTNHVRRYI